MSRMVADSVVADSVVGLVAGYSAIGSRIKVRVHLRGYYDQREGRVGLWGSLVQVPFLL